jgi:DNA-directed RNA polymerase III subunit RPC7
VLVVVIFDVGDMGIELILVIAREFFPEELHATILGEEGDGIRHAPGHSVKKKAGAFVNLNKAPNLTAAEKTKMLLEKLKDVTENEDGEGEVERDEDEENVDEEEADYDYEDDEAEMGGDYEAEQYFDGGEGDEDDGGEGGGGDDF